MSLIDPIKYSELIILPFIPIRREDVEDVEDVIEYVPVVDAILDPST